jgi:hypothetical protein
LNKKALFIVTTLVIPNRKIFSLSRKNVPLLAALAVLKPLENIFLSGPAGK